MKKSGVNMKPIMAFKAFLGILTILFFLSLLAEGATADTMTTQKPEALPISVKAILPENQKTGVKGYYDLQVYAGDRQTIFLQVTNQKNEDIVVTITPTNAYTHPTGGIFYEVDVASPETSLLDPASGLSDSIFVVSEMPVLAGQSVLIPIEITVPDMDEGTLLGGVVISEKEVPQNPADATAEKNPAQFSITTKTVFAVAIQLDFPGQSAQAFSFGEAGFNPSEPGVFIEMRNEAPLLQKGISGTYSVQDRAGHDLFTGHFGPMIMAPLTRIRYPMHWESTSLDQGQYKLVIQATVAGKDISVNKTFEVTDSSIAKYAKRSNQPITTSGSGSLNLAMMAGILGFCVIVGSVMFWLGKRKARTA